MFHDHMPFSYSAVFSGGAIAAQRNFKRKHPFFHPGLGDNGASIPLEVLDFDENSNQVASCSQLGKEELAKAISGEDSGYSSLGWTFQDQLTSLLYVVAFVDKELHFELKENIVLSFGWGGFIMTKPNLDQSSIFFTFSPSPETAFSLSPPSAAASDGRKNLMKSSNVLSIRVVLSVHIMRNPPKHCIKIPNHDDHHDDYLPPE